MAVRLWQAVPVLQSDASALKRPRLRPHFFGDECWKFQWHLRHTEYYNRQRGLLSKLRFAWHRYRLHRYSVLLGFSIPLYSFGPGLQIVHRGTIVVNDKAKIGKDCRIHVDVNIGEVNGQAPVIGNNVYIGPGVKIFGDIVLADDIIIGANAVVNKSFVTPGVTIAGVPAKVISSSQKEAMAYNP